MKIAQIAPLHESVPPKTYGGTERVVAYLTESLINAGHDVTLFASADSETSARLIPCCPIALRADPACIDTLARHIVQLQELMDRIDDFDVVHFHVDYLHFPLARLQSFPHITTLHGRLDIPDLQPLYTKFSREPVVSISYSQRLPLPQAYWVGNVYHGLPPGPYQVGDGKGGYLIFLGRVAPEKRIDRAIEIAVRAGKRLKIAAKIDKGDQAYFESVIKPLLENPLIEFLGEVGDAQKVELLGGAECMLFPIDWPEPFGMVMIEAMACGTPVIAFGMGSVFEVLKDGVAGYIVNSVDEAVEKVGQIPLLSRQKVRARFDAHFSADRMARDYVQVYQQQINAGRADMRQSAQFPDSEMSTADSRKESRKNGRNSPGTSL